jgi:hypothetical protein
MPLVTEAQIISKYTWGFEKATVVAVKILLLDSDVVTGNKQSLYCGDTCSEGGGGFVSLGGVIGVLKVFA